MKNDGLLRDAFRVLERHFEDIVSADSASSDHTIFIDTEKWKPATWRAGCDFRSCRAHIEGRASVNSGIGGGDWAQCWRNEVRATSKVKGSGKIPMLLRHLGW